MDSNLAQELQIGIHAVSVYILIQQYYSEHRNQECWNSQSAKQGGLLS